MDMSLFRRGDIKVAARGAAQLDYCVLVATLQALQLATPTARAESRFGAGEADQPTSQCDPLADIVLGGQRWQDAVLTQGGSFNPAFARGAEAP